MLRDAGMHVGIIGGGVAGLVAAYELAKQGQDVTVLEKHSRIGGMAGSFCLEDGHQIETYYHFICKPDRAYLEMMRELGIDTQLRWVTTKMGLFYKGGLHTLGDPVSLLRFPGLSWQDKLRFGLATVRAILRSSTAWHGLEELSAEEWLVSHYGQRTYDLLYKPLVDLKFREHASELSAAWMWARLHRLGNSRTLDQRERIGYLEGGTQLFIDSLEQAIHGLGANIRTGAEVEEVVMEGGRILGLSCQGAFHAFDRVISTIPIPALLPLVHESQGPYFDNLRSVKYLDVVTLVLRLGQSLTPYFWTNVSDSRINMPGFIEYTNLNPMPHLNGDSVVYIPQYLPTAHPFAMYSGEHLLELYESHLAQITPAFSRGWVRSSHVFRTQFAQPVCEMGFSRHIPAMRTPIHGFYLTDSYQLHPEDRTISNSITLGRRAATLAQDRGSGP
jgi:protoporphyrinogen oxidase